jgi:hypothetical protein
MSEIGKREAGHLVSWLNSGRGAGHDMEKLIRLANALNDRDFREDLEYDAVGQIADITAEYSIFLYPVRSAGRVLLEPTPTTPVSVADEKIYKTLDRVRLLLKLDELWRVRICQKCRRNFSAKRRRAAWCSKLCEKVWRKHDRQFRDTRACNAFEHYWQERKDGLTGRALREVEAREQKARARRIGKGGGDGKTRAGAL